MFNIESTVNPQSFLLYLHTNSVFVDYKVIINK